MKESGHCRNPQTESILHFRELPSLLDSTQESRASLRSPKSYYRDTNDQACDDDGECTAIDDVDEIEELAGDGVIQA